MANPAPLPIPNTPPLPVPSPLVSPPPVLTVRWTHSKLSCPPDFSRECHNGCAFLNSCSLYICLVLEQFYNKQEKILWALTFFKGSQSCCQVVWKCVLSGSKCWCHKLHSAISPSILHRFSRSQWLRKALEKTFRSVPVTSRGDQ